MASLLTSLYSLDLVSTGLCFTSIRRFSLADAPILQSKLFVDNLRTSQIGDPIV